ncbi:regulator of sigma E protease [Candidatus Hakubella thermalkaliphila]|uniref:Regulator of sigma E protease n=2 Tax=Candidatus Hakubella thermalkaliphila TaxID=2754717 RepID=A0A6V8PR96_9ACTN|nr:regulator of sigma E protease [Candidatus Hakubella thermalkaliphila]
MMSFLFTMAVSIIAFGAMIVAHEFGHFLAAKISGIGVEEFSIGFGPKLFSFRRGETVYGLGIFPLGGYNKLVGMDPTEQLATEDAGYPQRDGKTPVGMDPTERLATERERLSFYNKPILHRAFTILFGPSMNYVFAVFLLTVFFMMGTYFLTLEIESIMPDSAAEAAGFQAGDKVVAVEGQEIKDWEELVRITQEHPGDRLSYVVERDGEQLTIEATVGKRGEVGFLGIGPRLVKKELDLFPAALSSLRASYNITRLYFHGVIRLVRGQLPVEEARPVSPIGILNITQQVAARGWQNLLSFLAILNIILAISNLIPLLPLDGGHILLLLIEKVRGRRLSDQVVGIMNTIGIILLITIFSIALYLDIFNPINLAHLR